MLEHADCQKEVMLLDIGVLKEMFLTVYVSFQHREQRLVQENSQLQQQKDWLDQELKTKIDELLTIRKDQASSP